MNLSATSQGRPSIFQLVRPYWTSRESWKGWVLLVIKLVLMFTGVYVAVWSNQLDGMVVDAMVKREWEGLWPILGLAWGAGMVAVLVALLGTFLVSELIQYEWRTYLTRYYLDAWTANCAYYGIERDGSIDNADQRISQDIARFIELTLMLALTPIHVVASAVSFTVVLWNLSGTLEFSWGGHDFAIPGYMVYLVYAYSLGALAISHYAGRPLIGLFNRRQTVEANFRYQGMQLRENAEQVAFYDGGERERRRLLASFEDVRGNWRAIIMRTVKMTLARDVYLQTGSIVPTLAALPRYLSGAISLGDVTRVTGAFNTVHGALSFFTQAYVSFTEWLAVSNRLRDLLGSIEQVTTRVPGIRSLKSSEDAIAADPIALNKPNGEPISKSPPLSIRLGERWLIRGRSGAGKSTLLRAIAGIWPYGQGEVTQPRAARLLFLPQRSYIPYGTLKAALCYPGRPEDFDEARICAALSQALLPALAARLEDVDRWQQKLSGGEQQRLAIARALLHRPEFLFLDEATSALDPDSEQKMYEALVAALPGSTIVSVAHRDSLAAFHDHVLEIEQLDESPHKAMQHT